jgi:hypothetical protein
MPTYNFETNVSMPPTMIVGGVLCYRLVPAGTNLVIHELVKMATVRRSDCLFRLAMNA